MKFLIIDSHKGTESIPQNLHWINADCIRNHLRSIGHEVDLIWSYPSANNSITDGYDCIIFNHASRYSYISDEYISKNSSAKLFYITNEYNLGEPLILWSHAKNNGIQFDVIANHEMSASKVVKKYVKNWHIVNLNTLVLKDIPKTNDHDFFTFEKTNCIYYGSFRSDRKKYFQKYFTGQIVVSTHAKNREKFESVGVTGPFTGRLDWSVNELNMYKTSLYIEDESTHTNYNFLANRFYEALNYDVFPLFDITCKSTLDKSGYKIPDYALVDNPEQVMYITKNLPKEHVDVLSSWRKQAVQEKNTVLQHITNLVTL